MSELTPDRLAELRRIAEAATPGPEEIITPSHPVFDSTTVLVLLDEIERLRREREEIVDGETRFVLYHPDFDWWECQKCRFLWEFESGDPYEHDMRFCPRCGRRIVRERNKSKVTILPTVRAADCDGKQHLAGEPDQV